jgi:hypothetical protein
VIYVDEVFTARPRTEQAKRHGMLWCHLSTDGEIEELHAFAKRLGLGRASFQPHHLLPHYDIIPRLRDLAVRLGARETTTMERMQWAMQQRYEEKKEREHE